MIETIRVVCPLCRRWTDPVEMLRYVGCGWICARCFEAMREGSVILNQLEEDLDAWRRRLDELGGPVRDE